MIATSAFGHGVDYDQVRHILFFGLPYSLEDFGQQSGRAGQDGKPSSALLFFDARKEQFKMDNLPEDRKKSFQAMTFPSTFYLRGQTLNALTIYRYHSGCLSECLSMLFTGTAIEKCDYLLDTIENL